MRVDSLYAQQVGSHNGRPDGQPDEVHGDIAAAAEDERAELAGQLRLARDEGGEDRC